MHPSDIATNMLQKKKINKKFLSQFRDVFEKYFRSSYSKLVQSGKIRVRTYVSHLLGTSATILCSWLIL